LSLGIQTLNGVLWTLCDIVVNKSIYFISTILLARLLGPTEFGILGMILVFFAIGNTLIDSGLSVSIIRTANPSRIEYSTVFYLNIFISILAYLIVFFVAPLVADFYNEDSLVLLIRVYCLGFMITAIRIIPSAVLVKEMNFKKITIFNIPGNLVGLFVGVWMANNGYQVWSIVGLFLSTQILTSSIYLIFGKWKPGLFFEYKHVKHHWKFGYKLMVSGQVNTIFDNVNNILIGKLFGVQTLGYYERANTLSNYPMSVLAIITSKVSLPLFSNIVNDTEKARRVYRKVMLLSLYFTAPLMLGAIIIAEPLIIFFLGEKWKLSIAFFQILCLSYILIPIHSLNLNILSAFGRSDLFLRLELIKKAMFVLIVVIGLSFGVNGLLWSGVLSSVIALFINTHYSGRIINYSTREQLKDILPTLLLSASMFLILYVSKDLVSEYARLTQLFLLTLEGVLVFFGLSILTKNESLNDIIHHLIIKFTVIRTINK
jgi:O-antigen/teichoic acid export membrane protein